MSGAPPLPLSERRMHQIRWLFTLGWLILIASLFWDPFSSYLSSSQSYRGTEPACVLVQGQCLPQTPAVAGIALFWTLVVPGSILVLLLFGHETWRRICPLSFLSQIPRSLGLQRKRKVESRSGNARLELVKIRKDSWLGKNHLYVQFALLATGLALRLLLINSDRIALGVFLIATILAAIGVGYLYEGKSWCQYFCPMAPVQMVFNGPRGLLGSEAHQGQKQTITQSMCRTIDKEGNEKSACVGCQSPCIDIDAERNYWETLNKPGRQFVQYGYVGLLLGFFFYYFLYAGSFDYLFTGAWLHEASLRSTLLNPGFYLAGQAIAIPKIIAVPLTLGGSVAISYFLLRWVEKRYRGYLKQRQKSVSAQQATHTLFSICTFFCFNLFFFFSSRSLLSPFPFPIHLLFNGFIVLISTLWLARTLGRSSELYSRESLAGSLRRQLSKLTINFSRFLEGRSMEDLKAEEVYVLAKVLPGFNQEHGLQVYKGVLRETLEQGNADSASSLEVLRQIRQELNIKDEDHFTVLTELGVDEPELLDPKKRRTRESQLRLESYRQALASTLLDLVDNGVSLQEAVERQRKQIQFLKLEYGMSAEEEEQVLSQILAGEKGTILNKAEVLIEQMQQLAFQYEALNDRQLDARTPVFKFLRLTAIQNKQQIITRQMLGLLEVLGDTPDAIELASAIRVLAVPVLLDILQTSEGALTWQTRLRPSVFAVLEGAQPISEGAADLAGQQKNRRSIVDVLDDLLHELDPLIQSPALYGLSLLLPEKAREKAEQIASSATPGQWLAQETAQSLLEQEQARAANEVQTLILQVHCLGKTEKRAFQQPLVRVGSSPVNDVVLPVTGVAQHHAIFFLDSESFSVLDMGSSGGLFIDKRQLQNERDRLHQGQTVRFTSTGEPSITVQWERQPLRAREAAPTEEMGTLEKTLMLFESRFFRSLKPDALVELGRDAIVKVYPRGQRMCTAGDPSDSILLLIDGAAEVLVLRGDAEQVVGSVNVGETIGEMGVLTRQKRSATVVAASDYCRVLVIKADHFDAVLRQDPEIARNLLVVLSSRLQSMTNKLKAVSRV